MTSPVRRDPNQSLSPSTSTGNTWDPFRIMESLLGWNPGTYSPGSATADTYMPRFDVKETKDCYLFTADLPGIKEEDLDVSLTGNQLVISGKRECQETKEAEHFHLYERSYGRFCRSFSLPEGIDPEQVTANLKDGVLSLSVAKKPEVQPRRIQLGAGTAAAKA